MTELLDYRARYYSPDAGRFVSEDPFRFSAGTNFYSYADNNSVNHDDPSGLETYKCTAPLEALGDWAWIADNLHSKAHHEFLCVKMPDGRVTCGGQDRTGDAGWLDSGSPGKPSEDTMYERGGECHKISDANCIDQCMLGKFKEPRPWYNIRNKGGANCQKWAEDTIDACLKQCHNRKWGTPNNP